MTPKEKAEELFNKFINTSIVIDDDLFYKILLKNAKRLALIVVHEIIDTGLLLGKERYNLPPTQYYDFWQEVKSEIEKL